ncbi:glycosyltransferase [Candidatus Sumerlaeota bacterium]|nr:glycosyltransferase [Candidatus Sumerlaeota bacterium]
MAAMNQNEPVIIYFSAGQWRPPLPVGELRYPIYLIARRRHVLYVNPPASLLDRLSGKRRRRIHPPPDSHQSVPGTKMTVFTPSVVFPYSVRLPMPLFLKNMILNRNIQSITSQVLNIFHTLYPGREKPDMAWGTIFHHAGILERFPARHKLAIIDDNFPESPAFTPFQKNEVAEMERSLISSAEYIFTTSRTLFEEKARINPHCVMMENGVSDLFLPENREHLDGFAHQCPQQEHNIIEQIKSLPKPRIGYVGALNIRLWRDFLEEIFKAASGYQLVFIGNIDDSFPISMIEKMKNPNIHVFPYISHALIPYALEQFDLLVLPFELTRFSRFINPLKLSEYLSSGKPILATPLVEIKRIAGDSRGMVYFIENPKDIKHSIEKALREDSTEMRERRIALARARTWQRVTREMLSLVETILKSDRSDSSDSSDPSDSSDRSDLSDLSDKNNHSTPRKIS